MPAVRTAGVKPVARSAQSSALPLPSASRIHFRASRPLGGGFHHRDLQKARMLRVLIERHVGRSRILGSLRGDVAAAVVVLFQVDRIGRGEDQTQTTALLQAPREEMERCELVAINLAGLDQMLLTTRLAVACPLDVVGERNAGPVRLDLGEVHREIGIRHVQRNPGYELHITGDLDGVVKRLAVVDQAVAEKIQGMTLIGDVVLDLLTLQLGGAKIERIVDVPDRRRLLGRRSAERAGVEHVVR